MPPIPKSERQRRLRPSPTVASTLCISPKGSMACLSIQLVHGNPCRVLQATKVAFCFGGTLTTHTYIDTSTPPPAVSTGATSWRISL